MSNYSGVQPVCLGTSSLWLLRHGTNNFSDTVTKDCDKLRMKNFKALTKSPVTKDLFESYTL